MMAPATAAARMSAPVFRACMASRAAASIAGAPAGRGRVEESCPAASRSTTCPPTIPPTPAASATRASTRSFRAATSGTSVEGCRASTRNASVSSPSPVSTAMPSP